MIPLKLKSPKNIRSVSILSNALIPVQINNAFKESVWNWQAGRFITHFQDKPKDFTLLEFVLFVDLQKLLV